jgi:acyl transferase domain-containing protein
VTIANRILPGYITSGVGMSFWHAGQNNTSALDFSSHEMLQFAHAAVHQSHFNLNSTWELEQREKELEQKWQLEKEHQNNVQLADFLEQILEREEEHHQAMRELVETSKIVEFLRLTLKQMEGDTGMGEAEAGL